MSLSPCVSASLASSFSSLRNSIVLEDSVVPLGLVPSGLEADPSAFFSGMICVCVCGSVSVCVGGGVSLCGSVCVC